MEWPESLPELAIRNNYLIVHKHLCEIVEPADIERVFLRESLDALTQWSISALKSIFVDPENVNIFCPDVLI